MIPRIFLALALSFGTGFALLTPPFQSPDEYNHFYRAWQISEGHLFPEQLNGNRLGGTLPASLDTLKNQFIFLKNHYEAHLDPHAISRALDIRLEPERRIFLDFPNTAIYAPTAYAPQAIGILLARSCTDRVLVLLYAARLANLICWTLLVYFALRLMPFQRWSLAFLALLPASLFLSASANADIVTNGLAFWVIGLACQKIDIHQKGKRSQGIFGLAAGVLVAVHKLFLAPFGALNGLAALGKQGSWATALRQSAVPVAIMVFSALIWGQIANESFIPYDRYAPEVRDAQTLNPGVDPPAQWHFILQHPFEFTLITAKSLVRSTPSMLAHFVGKFGWEKNYLPGWTLALLWLALGALVFSEQNPFSARQRIFLAGIGTVCVALWSITMYALWCPVGAKVLDNWQGRYFVPVAPLFCLAFGYKLLERWSKWIPAAAVIAVLAGNVLMVFCILNRY